MLDASPMCEKTDIDWGAVVELVEEDKTAEACVLVLFSVNLLENEYRDRFIEITSSPPTNNSNQQLQMDYGYPRIGNTIEQKAIKEANKLTVLVGIALALREEVAVRHLIELLDEQSKKDTLLTPHRF